MTWRTNARIRSAPEGWDEATIVLPGRVITRTRTAIRMTGRYAAYRYWFFQ